MSLWNYFTYSSFLQSLFTVIAIKCFKFQTRHKCCSERSNKSVHIAIHPSSKIQIKCTKVGFTFGTLYATLMFSPNPSLSLCNSYANSQTTNNYCLDGDFFMDLSLSKFDLYYQFGCGILENSSIIATPQFYLRACNFIFFFFLFTFQIHFLIIYL